MYGNNSTLTRDLDTHPGMVSEINKLRNRALQRVVMVIAHYKIVIHFKDLGVPCRIVDMDHAISDFNLVILIGAYNTLVNGQVQQI